MDIYRSLCSVALIMLTSAWAAADGPADNMPSQVRAVPPRGIAVPQATIDALQQRAESVEHQLGKLHGLDSLSRSSIAVFPRAVRMTIETEMFYSEKEFQDADSLLAEAEKRLKLAQAGKRGADLLSVAAGGDQPAQPIASGFRSDIDGSVQPFGIVLPSGWSNDQATPKRLDVWLHGRGERVSEVGFLTQRERDIGQYTPSDTIVLHPYGRYCNAFKFAGEIDVLEAIEAVKQLVNIDDSRITIRGFSMGGAGCWQLAVHYPNIWAAANPGAGFSETTEFLKFFQQENFKPTRAQQSLLHWYDCPDWTNNLRNVPTIAYSGEIDKQKQAADIMEAAYETRGMQLTHIIGPQTAHKIHADSKVVIEDLMQQTLIDGKSRFPKSLDLTTYTLRYHELGWLSIEGLKNHWQESRVQGAITEQGIELDTSNVTQIRLTFNADSPLDQNREIPLRIDTTRTKLPSIAGKSGSHIWVRDTPNSDWELRNEPITGPLRKKPGLQGPIDDAFMSPFVFVPPDAPGDSLVEKWTQSEYEHATREWVRHFRGNVVSKDAGDVTTELMRDHNLILFGTPKTNSLIARIAGSLPIRWRSDQLEVGKANFDVATHAPILIYPNPLNPQRYVVINSGVTYREYAYLNNARQIPMLPDWAIVNVVNGATSQYPGRIITEGFFDEAWQLNSASN